ncbi:hypothetical protein JHK82_031541 [Glycine max]|nr:hypothetical protein JHK85_032195 [Glycine max]KAG5124804.1 hypothetical protein JHK82_031541 [Glycine max]
MKHLGDDGELSDKDAAALLRLRIMLCVPQQTIDAAHSDICGSWFEKVVKDTIASGVDGYGADIWKSVRKAAHGLRLTRDTAMSIASKTIRKIFINFIQRARAAGNHKESAKELKKMIAFNTLVVTELVNGIKEESDDESTEEPGKEETRVPFGAQIITKKDDSEYVLLNQLGGILGLSSKEIVKVHKNLAEQAFRQQAEVILADGQLTKARVEQLNNLQNQVGLPEEYS